MNIGIATVDQIDQIRAFFQRNLSERISPGYSNEYFCKNGVGAAIRRNEMLVAIEGKMVIAAARFYRRKQINAISLYQFAVEECYRGNQITMKMLSKIHDANIITSCPVDTSLNEFFRKTGWTFMESKNGLNLWLFPL